MISFALNWPWLFELETHLANWLLFKLSYNLWFVTFSAFWMNKSSISATSSDCDLSFWNSYSSRQKDPGELKLDEWIEKIKEGEYLSSDEVMTLCGKVCYYILDLFTFFTLFFKDYFCFFCKLDSSWAISSCIKTPVTYFRDVKYGTNCTNPSIINFSFRFKLWNSLF